MMDDFGNRRTPPPSHGVIEEESGIPSHNTGGERGELESPKSYSTEAIDEKISNTYKQLFKAMRDASTTLKDLERIAERILSLSLYLEKSILRDILDTIRRLEANLQKGQVGEGPCLLSQDRSGKRDVMSTETSQSVSDEDFGPTDDKYPLCFQGIQEIEASKGTLLDSPSNPPQPKWSSARVGSHLALDRHDPSRLAPASSLRWRYKTRIIVATTGLCLVSNLPLVAAQGPLAAGFRVASGVTSLGIGMAVLPLNAAEQVPGLAVILLYVAWAMCFVLYFWLQNQVIEDSSNYKRKLYAVAVGVSGVIVTIIFSHVFNQMNNGFALYGPIVFTATAYVASLFFGTEKRDMPAGLSDCDVESIELRRTQPTVEGAERT